MQNLSSTIISDRDPRFTSQFWTTLLERLRIKRWITATNHPSADGQAERTVQTVKTALRYLLVGEYEENWPEILPEVELAYNNNKSSATGVSPFEAVHGFQPTAILAPPHDKDQDLDFVTNRRLIWQSMHDAMTYTRMRMAMTFDSNHKPPSLEGKVLL